MKKNINFHFLIISLFVLLIMMNIIWQSFAKQLITTSMEPFSYGEHDANPDTSEINGKKRVALTFDDGPHPVYTLKLLEGLKQRGVKATFFVIGLNVKEYPEVVKQMSDEGHIIGNHTYSHVQLSCISESKASEEISMTNALIEEYTGKKVQYIRPPYGSLPKSLQRETDLIPVLWTVDPRDWSVLNTDAVVKHILSHVKDGDIILLHDIFETSVDAALIIVDQLTKEGYEFVTVDELVH
ncbi:MAG: polysaccharide deacetylase family protein [Lachnospiraceae bacterium]|nr:polysaccharide deacetylase family protein [Lachnospiraceae bacterium]